MLINSHLDLYKRAQLKNALLHIFDNDDISEDVDTQGQIVFKTQDKRIYCFDGTDLKTIAWQSDISDENDYYYQSEDPRLQDDGITYIPLTKPSIWYNPDTNDVKMYNIGTDTWATLSSINTEVVTLEEYVGGVTYLPNSVVIYNNRLWRNETGADITDVVWTELNWTNIGNTIDVADLRYNVYSILTTIVDGTTVNDVTRNGDTYTITHNYNLTYPEVFTLDSSNNKVMLDIEYFDVDNIVITFPESITENFFVVVKD